MLISSMISGPTMPDTSRTMPARVGRGCPVADEPRARAVTGVPVTVAILITVTTSCSVTPFTIT